MFYVSSIKGEKVGVTDTDDNVEEFYTDSQLAKWIKDKVVDIYGTSYYNYKANCTPIKINQTITVSKLNELLGKWRNLHNQWTGHAVEDYLASSKIGTKITVDYVSSPSSGGRPVPGVTVIKRLSYDEWLYKDSDNTFSGEKGDSRFAAWALEVACIYSRPIKISIS